MKKLLPVFLSLFLPLCAASASAAAFSPLQIGISNDHQLADYETPVYGLRLNLLFSMSKTAAGLDIGFASYARHFSGIRLNAESWSEGTVNGVEAALAGSMDYDVNGIQVGLASVAFHDMRGLQAGVLAGAARVYGVQIGLWSSARDDLCGLQIGLANFAESPHGLQLGIFNSAAASFKSDGRGTVRGIQVGLVNLAGSLRGLQIGLVNIATESDFPCLPLLRASF